MRKRIFRFVAVRHGHTEWNLTNRFTGWSDIPLSDKGIDESRRVGKQLVAARFRFDEVHVSALFRTRQSFEAISEAAAYPTMPVFSSWRLNERHYGMLQGMNKQEIFDTWGSEETYRWWRGYTATPPPLKINDPRHPRFSPLYKDVPVELLPGSESLAQCESRIKPYWDKVLQAGIRSGRNLLLVSHGNTIRSLRMTIEKFTPKDIENVEIPFNTPLVYHFDESMLPTDIYWLE